MSKEEEDKASQKTALYKIINIMNEEQNTQNFLKDALNIRRQRAQEDNDEEDLEEDDDFMGDSEGKKNTQHQDITSDTPITSVTIKDNFDKIIEQLDINVGGTTYKAKLKSAFLDYIDTLQNKSIILKDLKNNIQQNKGKKKNTFKGTNKEETLNALLIKKNTPTPRNKLKKTEEVETLNTFFQQRGKKSISTNIAIMEKTAEQKQEIHPTNNITKTKSHLLADIIHGTELKSIPQSANSLSVDIPAKEQQHTEVQQRQPTPPTPQSSLLTEIKQGKETLKKAEPAENKVEPAKGTGMFNTSMIALAQAQNQPNTNLGNDDDDDWNDDDNTKVKPQAAIMNNQAKNVPPPFPPVVNTAIPAFTDKVEVPEKKAEINGVQQKQTVTPKPANIPLVQNQGESQIVIPPVPKNNQGASVQTTPNTTTTFVPQVELKPVDKKPLTVDTNLTPDIGIHSVKTLRGNFAKSPGTPTKTSLSSPTSTKKTVVSEKKTSELEEKFNNMKKDRELGTPKIEKKTPIKQEPTSSVEEKINKKPSVKELAKSYDKRVQALQDEVSKQKIKPLTIDVKKIRRPKNDITTLTTEFAVEKEKMIQDTIALINGFKTEKDRDTRKVLLDSINQDPSIEGIKNDKRIQQALKEVQETLEPKVALQTVKVQERIQTFNQNSPVTSRKTSDMKRDVVMSTLSNATHNLRNAKTDQERQKIILNNTDLDNAIKRAKTLENDNNIQDTLKEYQTTEQKAVSMMNIKQSTRTNDNVIQNNTAASLQADTKRGSLAAETKTAQQIIQESQQTIDKVSKDINERNKGMLKNELKTPPNSIANNPFIQNNKTTSPKLMHKTVKPQQAEQTIDKADLLQKFSAEIDELTSVKKTIQNEFKNTTLLTWDGELQSKQQLVKQYINQIGAYESLRTATMSEEQTIATETFEKKHATIYNKIKAYKDLEMHLQEHTPLDIEQFKKNHAAVYNDIKDNIQDVQKVLKTVQSEQSDKTVQNILSNTQNALNNNTQNFADVKTAISQTRSSQWPSFDAVKQDKEYIKIIERVIDWNMNINHTDNKARLDNSIAKDIAIFANTYPQSGVAGFLKNTSLHAELDPAQQLAAHIKEALTTSEVKQIQQKNQNRNNNNNLSL